MVTSQCILLLRVFATGKDSLCKMTTGIYNTGVGYRAGYTFTTASYNTHLGFYAGIILQEELVVAH